MKIKIKETKEVEVTHLKVRAGVRYWEDASVNGVDDEDGELIPCRNGDNWEPLIELETGKIVNWIKGTEAEIHYKVCDDGEYFLLDKDGNTVKSVDGYVIGMMCPKDSGFGDYIIMDVDKDGIIQDFEADFSEFEDVEEDY